ncbi:hypothetical protein [Natronomonas sp. EA1]|uniref:hypothetical protein n=1 Tax=Natronomonas sp. EA1 TaxID=3421655 RepID=UPI003EBDA716
MEDYEAGDLIASVPTLSFVGIPAPLDNGEYTDMHYSGNIHVSASRNGNRGQRRGIRGKVTPIEALCDA